MLGTVIPFYVLRKLRQKVVKVVETRFRSSLFSEPLWSLPPCSTEAYDTGRVNAAGSDSVLSLSTLLTPPLPPFFKLVTKIIFVHLFSILFINKIKRWLFLRILKLQMVEI